MFNRINSWALVLMTLIICLTVAFVTVQVTGRSRSDLAAVAQSQPVSSNCAVDASLQENVYCAVVYVYSK